MTDPDPLAAYPTFATAVRHRLDAGARVYGDRSFSAEPAELIREVQAELLDVCGWSFVLWTRLEAMRADLAANESPAGTAGMTPKGTKP